MMKSYSAIRKLGSSIIKKVRVSYSRVINYCTWVEYQISPLEVSFQLIMSPWSFLKSLVASSFVALRISHAYLTALFIGKVVDFLFQISSSVQLELRMLKLCHLILKNAICYIRI